MLDSEEMAKAGMDDPRSQADCSAMTVPIEGTAPHIKRVSRIKHRILQQYLPAWSQILGAWNQTLCYVDCFAGPGEYELGGRRVHGSPVIAVETAKTYVSAKPGRRMTTVLIEKDASRSAILSSHLKELQPYPPGLDVRVLSEDSNTLLPDILSGPIGQAPSFFMIDPYGHPLSVPLINQILGRQRAEALINLMWYRINMDLSNPAVQHKVDKLVGDGSWRDQPFMKLRGIAREEGFLSFFCSKLKAEYKLPFRIGFDQEDRVHAERTKYYLLHASNHPKAVLLMKKVMWPLGNEDGTFDFSGEAQGVLISRTPRENELRDILLREFSGQKISFDRLLERTWKLPFIEKQYRSVLQGLRKSGAVTVTPVTSKSSGLKGGDLVDFSKVAN